MTLSKYRRITQILFLLVFVLLFLKARFPYSDTVPADLLIRFSPLIPLFDFIDKIHISPLFWPALIILLLTPVIGRFFCGWICPLGTTLDAASHTLKSPPGAKSTAWDRLRPLKFVIFIGSIILAVMSENVWGYFDPLSIFNRALTAVVYPFTTRIIEGGLVGMSMVPLLETPAFFLLEGFKAWVMPEKQAFLQQTLPIALFFGLILGLEKVTRRFWCRYVCPAGALLGFLAQFRIFERLVNTSTCSDCMKCVKECKMGAIPLDEVAQTSKVECIECFSCADNCPPKLAAIEYRWNLKPYHTKPDYSRKQFLQTTFGSFIALGLLSIGIKDRTASSRIIRPPGSLPEEDFLDRCIRCLECVRICTSNGACLQPDQIHNSIFELWAPAANMREGYCEYNCNLCTQVCPTEAILPLELEQKQRAIIGLAYFDKNLCIPYAKQEECIVCEEHCPLPDKAIKLEEKDVELYGGGTRRLKLPYIKKELCTGCGICEHKCPLPGEPGIFVTGENEVRLTPADLPVA